MTHCQNAACGKKLTFRRPSERGRKKFCSIGCVGVAKHGTDAGGVSQRTQERIGEIKWLLGTDIPQNIATRTGYGDVDTMLRALDRAREFKLSKRIRDEHRHYLQAVEDDDDE